MTTILHTLEAVALLPLALIDAITHRLAAPPPPQPPVLQAMAAATGERPELGRQPSRGAERVPIPTAHHDAAQGGTEPAMQGLPVVALRQLARERLGASVRPGGRRIAQARRADLLAVLAA